MTCPRTSKYREAHNKEIEKLNQRLATELYSERDRITETLKAVQEVKQTLAIIKKGVTDLANSEKQPTVGPKTFAQAPAKPKNP